jgi:mRNA interferase HigB
MRIVGRDRLHQFAGAHSDARAWIGNWIAETEAVRWRKPQDIKELYASASFLAENIVIFNVKGNRYRLEVLVAYNSETVVVRWIGTHAEYTKRND